MIKRAELTDPNSCMSRAHDDEMTFVLLARDAAAPVAIRAWCVERVRLGKNKVDDKQICEAIDCAHRMEYQRESSRPPSPTDTLARAEKDEGLYDLPTLGNTEEK